MVLQQTVNDFRQTCYMFYNMCTIERWTASSGTDTIVLRHSER